MLNFNPQGAKFKDVGTGVVEKEALKRWQKYLLKYGIWDLVRCFVAGSGGAVEHCQGGERSNGGLPLHRQVAANIKLLMSNNQMLVLLLMLLMKMMMMTMLPSNEVPPAVSKRISLNVNCKLPTSHLLCISIIYVSASCIVVSICHVSSYMIYLRDQFCHDIMIPNMKWIF